jgi:serum/glucocorticoid-regulated kinase 2
MPIFKYNYKNKKQERIIVITNFNLYNLKVPDVFNNFIAKLFSSAIMRRKIPLQKIAAVTVSRQGFEFVIHVPEEYDYRYCSIERFYFKFF